MADGLERVCVIIASIWCFYVVFNMDDNVARYIGQLGAEVAKGFASGGVP